MHTVVSVEYVRCPHPDCPHMAEVLDRQVLTTANGAAELLSTFCLVGHGFFYPTGLSGTPPSGPNPLA